MEKFDHQLYGDSQFKSRPKSVYRAYARAVWEVLHPQSILDLGCANAYALEWWQKQGIPVSGVEPALAAYKYMPASVKKKVKPWDLREKLKLPRADVINLTEVAEHIGAKYETAMLKNVAGAVKNFLVIAWSDEVYADKPAEHVNPRPAWYVKIRLRRLGLYLEPELTRQLKQKLTSPELKDWTHWAKHVLVFSRMPQPKRVLIRHWQWLPSFNNKNLGYFALACRSSGFGPRWVSNDWPSLFKRWHRVWLYPFEKHLLVKLLVLKLLGNKTIIKLDSQILPRWRAGLIKPLVYKILAESAAAARPFGGGDKIVRFSGGLPQKNISLIKSLKVKREKVIVYSGRQTYQKGFDRLRKIIPSGWKLKVVSDLSGAEYYREILRSSLVVLPSRGEGWPNVFQDAFYCRRLFLTTTGAQCADAVLDKTFYCQNSVPGLKKSLKKITDNIDACYRRYAKIYKAKYFQPTDAVFSGLLK